MKIDVDRFNECTEFFTPYQVGIFINILIFINETKHITFKKLFNMSEEDRNIMGLFKQDSAGLYYSEITDHE